MLEVKQIIELDEETLNVTTKWMYEWGGKEEGYSIDAIKCFMKHSILKDRLPQTYGLFLDGKIIGMYQFTLEDLNVRPDIYPWLANVYIDSEYRGKGYGRVLLETVKDNALNNTPFKTYYGYTKHISLYEKFGWVYQKDLDTYKEDARIQRLYKLDLK